MIRNTVAKGRGELRARVQALLALAAEVFVLGLPAVVQLSTCGGPAACGAVPWPWHQTDLG